MINSNFLQLFSVSHDCEINRLAVKGKNFDELAFFTGANQYISLFYKVRDAKVVFVRIFLGLC